MHKLIKKKIISFMDDMHVYCMYYIGSIKHINFKNDKKYEQLTFYTINPNHKRFESG